MATHTGRRLAALTSPLAAPAPTPTPATTPAAPVIKWVGGKTKLLGELVARMPMGYGRYYEPFAGGAALFFRVAPGRAVLADSNADLIALYRVLASDAGAVIRKLEHHRAVHDDRHYYATRARWNDPEASWSAVDRGAAFIYLNTTCSTGLGRAIRAAWSNVPIARYPAPPICVPEALRAASAALRRA